MITVKNVDTSRFDAAWDRYMLANKREPKYLVDKVAYEVAKIWVSETKTTPKDTIKEDLAGVSRISPTMTKAEAIVRKIQVTKGLTPSYGPELRKEGIKYTRKRMRSSNFLKSGGIPPIRILEPIVKGDKGKNTTGGIKTYGVPKGGAKAANEGWVVKSQIWNSVQGGIHKWFNAPPRNTDKVQSILEVGAQKALDKKAVDLDKYSLPRLNKSAQDFNHS